ncbi:hypothetical protein Tco_1262984 [Tanacetum coccineum]
MGICRFVPDVTSKERVEPLVRARQLAAATVAAVCVGVRQRLAATVAAAKWWVAKAAGFIPTNCYDYPTSPDLTQVANCPNYHEPSIFVSANVMDRSIGIDNPCLSWTDISQANTVSFESDYGCPGRTPEGHFFMLRFCLSDMSNSDELRHTDNTTLVPPRLPDTLPQVYHRRRPTLGLLVLPSVLPNPPTIRRTARISIPPIEPNLAERARIAAINLDDYQLDPLTPPPSPSSPFTMAAYQRMIAETDPTQREEALTETGQNSVPVPETALTVCTTRLRGQLHTILEDMDRYPNACLEELEAFMTLWDVKPRVEESSLETLSVDELITQLRQLCEDAEDRASNAQEEARQKRKEALEEVVQQIYRTNN